MEYVTKERAISILRSKAPNEEAFTRVLRHSIAVMKLALEISEGIRGINRHFIMSASLLHDTGRFVHPPGKSTILHGIAGSRILRGLGLYRHARVAERHLGVGISREDIIRQKLPLPRRDFLPLTKEEKIITYADNLIAFDKRIMIEDVAGRFVKEIGKEYEERVWAFHREIMAMVDGRRKP